MAIANKSTATAFQLKGSVLTLSILQIINSDPVAIEQQLTETVKKNPNLFTNMPVIIDLQKIYSQNHEVDFKSIQQYLRQHRLVPVAVTNGNKDQLDRAAEAGLGILINMKTTAAPKNTAAKKNTSKVISQPIRSGQQIYAKNCDLIVLASVSNGAEILADGNIHVYGTMRGRAIAGVSGNKDARIFCHKLEAELVCIAGVYKLHEDFTYPEGPNGTCVFLENEQLSIVPIGH